MSRPARTRVTRPSRPRATPLARPRATRAVAALVLAASALAACGTADPAPGTTAAGAPTTQGGAPSSSASGPGSASGASPGPGEVVQACGDPVEGFGLTVDGDGAALPEPEPAAASATDPRELTGPSSAVVADESIVPVAADPQPALPVTVESCDGATVEVTDTSRILAIDLYGTLAEIVFSLGMGEHVVGRDTSTGFPEAADLPVVTPGAHDLSAEAILALDPSVVLTDASIGPQEVQLQLRDAGIPVIFFDDARSLDSIPTHIRAVAGALGVADAGEELVTRTQEEITAARTLGPAGSDPLRIAFLYLRGGMVQLLGGPGSGADALVQAIGAADVGTELGLETPFTQITAETMIQAEPDVILMMSAGLDSVGGPTGLEAIPGLAQTPAVAAGRVVDMEDTILLSFGPRTGRTLDALARAVYRPEG